MSSKNTLPFAGRFCFSWHPAPAAASIALFASPRISDESGVRSVFDLIADKQHGGSMANHGSI
jgi:hypothetical protein